MATSVNSSTALNQGTSKSPQRHQQGQGASFESLDKSSSNTLKVNLDYMKIV
jgi:hypothetical protein